jgi:hypothetical protein
LEIAISRLEILDFAHQASKLRLQLLLCQLMSLLLLSQALIEGSLSPVAFLESFAKQLHLPSVSF